jgi:5-methylcytosine-specific restriction endonuclease McrA
VPRRRAEIFERSQGKCHYCGEVLTLDGKWHVEHQFPRALGGGNGSLNLVAACVRCNLAKSDRTAIEFMVDQER